MDENIFKTDSVQTEETDVSDDTNSFTNWDDAGLNRKLLRGVYSYGFEKPSPIQQKSILPMMSGRDTIAQAQSGTGKTGAFTVGSLQMLDMSKK